MTPPDTQAGAQPAATAQPPARDVTARPVNHVQLAALSAVLAGVLAAGAYTGTVGTLVAVAVLQAVLVPCWVLGHRLPGRIGGLLIGSLAAAAADGFTLHWPDSGYSPVLGVLGVAIPVLFAHQLTRGVVRTRVVESLAGLALLLVAVVAPVGLIVLRHQPDGRTITLSVVAALGVGLVAAHLMDAVLPAPRFDPAVDRGLPAVLVGVVAGGALGYLGLRSLIDFAGGRAIFAGAAVAAVSCLLSIAASFADTRTAEPAAGAVTQPAAAQPAAESPAGSPPQPSRLDRLRPAAAVAVTIAFTVPAGYVLCTALTS